MPRGEHPNSRANLKNGKKYKKDEKKTKEQVQAMKDGWAKRRTFKQAFDELLEREITDSNGNTRQGVQVLAIKVFNSATEGNMKAVEIIRDTVGEKPVEKVQVENIEPATISEVEDFLNA